MRPSLTKLALFGMGMLLLALLLVLVGAIIGRDGGAWLLPFVAFPVIAELVLLWQQNMEWLGKFLLTTDGILCESPLSPSSLLRWDEIEDCYYLPGKTPNSGTYCLSTAKLTLKGDGKLPSAPKGAKFVKITERAGLHEALCARLPDVLGRKLDADRML
jgi:hypothetical protein